MSGKLLSALIFTTAAFAVLPHPAGLGAPAFASTPADAAVAAAMEDARIGDLSGIHARLADANLLPADRHLLQAQRAAALADHNEAAAALRSYAATGDSDPDRRARAVEISAEMAFLFGRYADAVPDMTRYLERREKRKPHEIEAMERMRRLADLLSGAPPQRIEQAGIGSSTAYHLDKVGLPRTSLRVNGQAEEAVIDTGANLSVASESSARRMNLRAIEGRASVGNSIGTGVDVRLAIGDRVEVAGAVLRNVVFLVLADEALTFPVPGGYRIDTIIGLPMLRALGRMRFAGDRLHIEPTVRAGAPNLRLIGSMPYAVVGLAGHDHSFLLDTGANRSALSLRFAAHHPEITPVEGRPSRRAGAGGVEEIRNREVERLAFRIGDAQADFRNLDIDAYPAPGDETRYGVLGADLFRNFGSVTVDFAAMRLEVEEKAAEEAAAAPAEGFASRP